MARLLHPAERRKSDGELIKACRNVFEVAASLNRKKEQSTATVEENIVNEN